VMVFGMIFSIVYNALCISRKSIIDPRMSHTHNSRKPIWTGTTTGVAAKGGPQNIHKGT
jgi:hypothetical protein